MKFYNLLIDYINKNHKNFIFIVVFYSLWLAYKFTSLFDPELHNFSGRMVGEATLQGYDISKRIAIFYQTGAVFFFSIIVFSIIFWGFSARSKEFFRHPEIRILNYTSLAGIILLFFNIWGSSVATTIELVFCIQITMLSGLLLKKLFLKNNENAEFLNSDFYSIAFTLGVSVFFLWNELSAMFGLFSKGNLSFFLFTVVSIICFLAIRSIKSLDPVAARNRINNIAFLLFPMVFIPLLSVVKDELYLILNGHEIYFFIPRRLYMLSLFCLVLFIAWRMKVMERNPLAALEKNTYQLVAKRYFPMLVLGIACFTFYDPFITLSTEMFESGNRFLPLMEFRKSGVVPIIEKFNAHELSELFFGGIYAFLNGLNGREMLIYDFMNLVIWLVLVYYFIYRLSRNAYAALFITLIFPLTGEFIHAGHAVAFIAIFMLHEVINRSASQKNYLLLFSCIAFLILWRMDIGYPALIATGGTLFIYWLNDKRFVFDKKLLFKSIFIFAGIFILILGVIALSRGINIFKKMSGALNYLASAQSYGYVNLGDASAPAFRMQHYVFPFIIISGLFALLVSFRRFNVSVSGRNVYIAVVFLTIYFLANFQRGIVAHTFAAGSDGWLSPFLFLILSGSIYLFFHKRSQVAKFILFVLSASFLVMNYKYPAVAEPQNTYSRWTNKVRNYSAIDPRENISRIIDEADTEKTQFSGFRKLVAEQLNEEQTFIDFSNTPMLYYLTGKISPSYFYQNPLTIHNDQLQNNFISELKEYDTPLLIFSHFPETYWDNVNGVPNGIRHYRMAEYFYQNYRPYVLTDGLCIWKRNDLLIENKIKNVFYYNKDTLNFQSVISGEAVRSADKKYYFSIKYKNYSSTSVITLTDNGVLKQLSSVFGNKNLHLNYYFVPDSMSGGKLKFSVDNSNNSVESIILIECDHLPDFYSGQPKRYDLKLLPYIWGTYDDRVHNETIIADLLSNPLGMTNGKIEYFNFASDLDKSSGNTIFISLQCDNAVAEPFELMYGSSRDGYKGTYSFIIPPGKGTREFAVRISSQFNWYSKVDYVGLVSQSKEQITLNKIQLLKGS